MAVTDLTEKVAIVGGAVTPTRYGYVLGAKHPYDPYYASHGGPEGEGPYDPFPTSEFWCYADLGAYGGAGTPTTPPPWECIYPNNYPTTTNQYLLHWTAGHSAFGSPLYGYFNVRWVDNNDNSNLLTINSDYRINSNTDVLLASSSGDYTNPMPSDWVSNAQAFGFPPGFFGPGLNIGTILLYAVGGGTRSCKVTHFALGFYRSPL